MQEINDRLYSWASDFDAGTILQAEKTARLPIVVDHVALMPDAHVGIGATVGSVIPTDRAIIPAAVGVDIGCGMIATRLDLSASDLPDDLDPLLSRIERAIPAGVGKAHDGASHRGGRWFVENRPPSTLTSKQEATTVSQFGTLGSGNHFVEVCLDEADRVWLVLHSGSRGIGNQLARVHIDRAKTLARELEVRLEDPDLAYFVEGQPEFRSYVADMLWAQEYALGNREAMMDNALVEVLDFVGRGSPVERINCHHNFTRQEVHAGFERPLWITRKGAIKADVGDRGVIPGSMGTRSYVVTGLGNPESWNSCSHGAGRRFSRSAAKREFTVEDLAEQMQGKTWLADRAAALLDEIPSAYKDIDVVMNDQKDLVRIDHTLRQILNYKGA